MDTAKYYDKIDEKTGLTPCKQDIKDGKISILEVPEYYRDSDMYNLAYDAADTEEKKVEINAFITAECERYRQKDPQKSKLLYNIYVQHNCDEVAEKEREYFCSMQCCSDLLNGKIKIYDIPFKYRGRSQYIHAYRWATTNKNSYEEKQERKLIEFQLLSDIIRCRKEGLKHDEMVVRDIEKELFEEDFETSNRVSLL